MLTGKAANDFVYIQMAITDPTLPASKPDVLFLAYESSYTLKPAAVPSTTKE